MQITWYGHSAFRLDFGGKAVLIDPFFTSNPAFVSDRAAAMKGVTHIVLTHGHSDHVGDALEIGDRFTMSPVTAALAVKRFFKLDTVIPCHYGSFPIIEKNADKFVAEMKGHTTKVVVPDKGKAFSV